MLKVHIQSEAVRRNIDLFKQIVAKTKPENFLERSKTYTAVVNRITGAMRFSETEGLDAHEWRHIIICVDLDKHDIQVFDKKSQEKTFECRDFEPTAYRIVAETLMVLQEAVKQVEDVKEFSDLEIEPSALLLNRDLIHEAWHQLDRAGAESLLKGKNSGVYIFRKDPYASILEEQLEVAHGKPVKCLTLTFIDGEQIVRDKTVVRYDHHWLFYNDNPKLSEKSFESIKDLLASMGDQLKQPLKS